MKEKTTEKLNNGKFDSFQLFNFEINLFKD